MVHYKITYFNLRGRAELARLILHHAQVPFEDFRFERTEWPTYKPKMPFGQVPVLEVDGKVLAQSFTIARYLAREHGLAGKDNWEQAQADMYVDCIGDLIGALRPVFMEQDPEKKKEMLVKLHAETVQPHLAKIEQRLVDNGTGYLVGNSLTWADLAYYSMFVPMSEKVPTLLDSTPQLKKLLDEIGEIPQIKKYVETRPKTDI